MRVQWRSIATKKSINKHLSQNQQKSRQIRRFAGIFSVNKTKKRRRKMYVIVWILSLLCRLRSGRAW